MKKLVLLIIGLLFILVTTAKALDYSSTNFINRDPIVSVQGGKSTSASFQLFTDSGQIVLGQSSSTNFIGRAGFFYFPLLTSPVVSATAGNGQVSLTWTSAVGSLGLTVTEYEVGQATVSGGPYTYTNVGNVLSSTRTSLTNGSTYYFVIRAFDKFGDPLVTSTQVSAAPVAPSTPPADSGGGGGGGGGAGFYPPSQVQSSVTFAGRAYPLSKVTLLKDAQKVASTVAGPDSLFLISLAGLTSGNYIFSLYTEDKEAQRSGLSAFPIELTAGASTKVSGIFLTPTIGVDKSQVKQGDNIAIFGQSAQSSDIVIAVNSENEIFVKTKSDGNGVYLYNLDTSPLEIGSHLAKSKAARDGEISGYSGAANFKVSNTNVKKTVAKCAEKADLNDDCKVDLIDFSIAAFWFKRAVSESFAEVEGTDLSGDGKIDLVDFSIMAYYWTG